MKKWYTENRKVDLATGELLTDSQIQRENWIKSKKIDHEIQDCGGYMLKIIYYKYERNRQTKLDF